jgi:hypothetical protein
VTLSHADVLKQIHNVLALGEQRPSAEHVTEIPRKW